MYDYMIYSDTEGNLVPGVLYKWEESADNLTWTLYVREGIIFQNGDRLGPEDVKFTLERNFDPKVVASDSPEFVKYIESIELAPPDKVVVRLKKPWLFFPYFISPRIGSQGMVTPKKYFQEVGRDNFIKGPIGSGSYKWEKHGPGSYIRLEAVDYSHWRVGVPKFKYVTFTLVREEETRIARLMAGEVDVIPVSLARIEEIKKAGFFIHRKEGSMQVDMQLHRQWQPDNPLSKVKVRQALAHAIDYDAIIKHIMAGIATPTGAFVNMFTWGPDYEPYPNYKYDPALAKRLLAEAGYPTGFDIYILSHGRGIPEVKDIALVVASDWEKIGIKVHIRELDYAAYRPIWMGQQEPPGPAVTIYSWPNRVVGGMWETVFGTKGTFRSHSSAEMDQLIARVYEAKSLDEYIKSSRAAMRYAYDNAIGIGFFTTDEVWATDKKIPQWNLGKDPYDLNLTSIYKTK